MSGVQEAAARNQRRILFLWCWVAFCLMGFLVPGPHWFACSPSLPVFDASAPETISETTTSRRVKSNAGAKKTEQDTKLLGRLCPDSFALKPASSFVGGPCPQDKGLLTTDGRLACPSLGCVPSRLPKSPAKASSGFFQDCQDTQILCVGVGREAVSLADAERIFRQQKSIHTIKIAKGDYQGSALFENRGQLRLLGESSDPTNGTRIMAPVVPNRPSDYAAISIRNISSLQIERIVFSGAGYGLFLRDCKHVAIRYNNYINNAMAGLRVENYASFSLEDSKSQHNGATLTKDNKLNTLFFGIVLRSQQDGTTSILRNTMANNGAGGLLFEGDSQIAVKITHNHRVTNHDNLAVKITHNHRVIFRDNHVYHNGPSGFLKIRKKAICHTSCSLGSFCEGGVCLPDLQVAIDPNKPRGAVGTVGIGVSLAGAHSIELVGNGFFANDSSALSIYATTSLELKENAVERNGIRPFAEVPKRFLYPAIRLWGVVAPNRQTKAFVSVQDNLLLDSLTTGFHFLHAATQRFQTTPTTCRILHNHVSGQGRFSASGVPLADGIRLNATTKASILTLDVGQNAFVENRRIGFFAQGAVSGSLTNNVFKNHPWRSLVFHELTSSQALSLSFARNTIDGGHGYGMQFFDGNAELKIESNRIEGIQTPLGGQEADAINVTNFPKSLILVKENHLLNSQRGGVFLANTSAQFVGNIFERNSRSVITQQNAKATGIDASNVFSPPRNLPNRKDF